MAISLQAIKTWFITGTSRGFGAEWTTAALERGDRVVATARNVDALKELTERHPDTLLALPLDVTDRPAVFASKLAPEGFSQALAAEVKGFWPPWRAWEHLSIEAQG